MTEQNLSLDEMIELAKVFSNKGKWSFFDGDLFADKIDGVYMRFLSDKTSNGGNNYSLHLCTDGRSSDDTIGVQAYFVELDTPEEYKKMQELYSLLEKGVRATMIEEQRRKDAEGFSRYDLVRQRKEQAIDAAKKLIGK